MLSVTRLVVSVVWAGGAEGDRGTRASDTTPRRSHARPVWHTGSPPTSETGRGSTQRYTQTWISKPLRVRSERCTTAGRLLWAGRTDWRYSCEPWVPSPPWWRERSRGAGRSDPRCRSHASEGRPSHRRSLPWGLRGQRPEQPWQNTSRWHFLCRGMSQCRQTSRRLLWPVRAPVGAERPRLGSGQSWRAAGRASAAAESIPSPASPGIWGHKAHPEYHLIRARIYFITYLH